MKQSVSILLLFTGALMLLPSIANALISSSQQLFPQSPDTLKTIFLLYTRESASLPQTLDARYPEAVRSVWTNFKARPTKFIVHGFLHTVKTWPLVKDLADKLLKHGDYNVIVVDWSAGNQLPFQSNANARVVGAQIAELINHMIRNGTLTAEDFHIIGHSLGATVAGHAGERVAGLGRITGLDPGRIIYPEDDIRDGLDDTDAKFVDVINSDDLDNLILGHDPAGTYIQGVDNRLQFVDTDANFVGVMYRTTSTIADQASGLSKSHGRKSTPGWRDASFGTKTEIGHVNFFPNGGHDQPGCERSLIPEILESGLVRGAINTVVCSHERAARYFNESINSPCPFLAFPCQSEDHFQKNLCQTCGGVGCSRMGFHADKYKSPAGQKVSYYLSTGGEAPFCRYHYTVTVKFSSGPWRSASGEASILISGNLFKTSWVSLTGGKTTKFNPGESLTFYVDIPQDVGNVTAVSFKFQQSFSLLSLGQKPNVGVDEIGIYVQETGARFKLCAAGNSLDFGSYITLISAC